MFHRIGLAAVAALLLVGAAVAGHVSPSTGALWLAYGTSTSNIKYIYHPWWPNGTQAQILYNGRSCVGTVAGKPGYSIPNAVAHVSKGMKDCLRLGASAVLTQYVIHN
jgi:hypothetical protein